MPKVYVSVVVDAPVGRVWPLVRDFNRLPEWTPFVADSRIEQGRDAAEVGCVRYFHLKDGDLIRERLLALSDFDCTQVYTILESPLGVTNYIATLKLTPVTDGDRTFAEWSAEFECEPGREAALIEGIGKGVFLAGLQALKARFA